MRRRGRSRDRGRAIKQSSPVTRSHHRDRLTPRRLLSHSQPDRAAVPVPTSSRTGKPTVQQRFWTVGRRMASRQTRNVAPRIGSLEVHLPGVPRRVLDGRANPQARHRMPGAASSAGDSRASPAKGENTMIPDPAWRCPKSWSPGSRERRCRAEAERRDGARGRPHRAPSARTAPRRG